MAKERISIAEKVMETFLCHSSFLKTDSIDQIPLRSCRLPHSGCMREEPRREKICLGFRPGPTLTGLYDHGRWLEAYNVGFRLNSDSDSLCSETNGADQLHSHCAADLRLCFRICKKQFFHDAAQRFQRFLFRS